MLVKTSKSETVYLFSSTIASFFYWRQWCLLKCKVFHRKLVIVFIKLVISFLQLHKEMKTPSIKNKKARFMINLTFRIYELLQNSNNWVIQCTELCFLLAAGVACIKRPYELCNEHTCPLLRRIYCNLHTLLQWNCNWNTYWMA